MSENCEEIRLGKLCIQTDAPGVLFSLFHMELGNSLKVTAPSFEVDGRTRNAFEFLKIDRQVHLPENGLETELIYTCGDTPQLNLKVIVRSFAESSIIRFMYRLEADQPAKLTKSAGRDQISYFQLEHTGFASLSLAEIQLSHFDPVQHSYMPARVNYSPDEIIPGMEFIGPISLFHSSGRTILCAYEHGADCPDSFFTFKADIGPIEKIVSLEARKGNYFAGQSIGPEDVWESVWFELGLYPGGIDTFLPEYRRFFLKEVCENPESRKPYIYYNTWNYQERQKYYHNRPYLEAMNAERMIAEIEVANQLGIDVFVVDTGWYRKTGDWLPNTDRFPEGLRELKTLLDQYGMKLGLWFNPTVAAITSQVFQEHPEWEMEWDGKPRGRGPIWETEESASMCLASDYVDYYINVMVRLNQELGVTYFKWDAVSQYGCDSANHRHGAEFNSVQERRDCYAYQMGRSMIRIVEEVTRRCPGVIVDFDITEAGRFVGLGFLSAGKFFLVNNGPYFSDLDIPKTVKIDPDTINVFFNPGPARSRVCRQGIKFDDVIPSILFLTHYLPDPPGLSQSNSFASMILGGNGIWGDLPSLSEDDIDNLSERIALYKKIAPGMTSAYPRKRGFAGSSPEVYEKIDPDTCSGAVIFFTVAPGTFTYYTQSLNMYDLGEVIGSDDCVAIENDRLKLTVTMAQNESRVVFIIPK